MNWGKIFKLVILSHLKQQKLSIFFAIISIMLGVSIYVAIRLTTTNIFASFEASTSYISEKDTVLITSSTAIPETIIPKLMQVSWVDAIIPISIRYVPAYTNTNIGYIQLVGVDILAINQLSKITDYFVSDLSFYNGFLQDMPIQAFVTKRLAEKVGYSPLKVLINGEYHLIQPKAAIENATIWGDEVIIVDIKNFQNLFKEYETSSQLRLTFNTTNIESVITELTKILPGYMQITQGNDNTQYAKNITSTYRFNLNFLTCLALIVTAIIIYNAISFYILERRRDFGIMLILGAKPGPLFLIALLTAMLLAICCAIGGLIIGYLITWVNIKYIVQTFSSLFLPLSITEVILPMSLVFEVIFIVVSIALLVGVFPCLEVYKIPATQTPIYQTYEKQFQNKITKFTGVGLLIFIISLISIMPIFLKLSQNIVFYSISGLLISSAFFLPLLLRFFMNWLRKIVPKNWVEAIMAIDHIKSTIRKNVVAIAAMSITISLYLTSNIVIDSTRYTCINWANQILAADIYINSKYSTFAFMGNYIPNEIVDYISEHPDVKAANFLSHKDVNFHNKSLRIIGMVYPVLENYYKLPMVYHMTENELKKALSNPQNVFISEHLAHEFNYHVGDKITIPSKDGSFQGKIANIFYNYSNFQNVMVISNSVFLQLFGDPRVESALLYLKDPDSYKQFFNSLKQAFPDAELYIQNEKEIKKIGTNMLEQTFKISSAIIVAIFILTALTLFNVIEQLILSRRHELTIFWAIGANDKSLIKMCLWESFFVYIAAVLGAIIPTLIGVLLIFNYLTSLLFGLNLILVISFESIFVFLLLLFLLVILDGLIPGLKIPKFINAKGLRNE